MIEGLKVIVTGAELKELCEKQAGYHAERAATYRKQVDGMVTADVEPMQYSGGDPIKALRDKRDSHQANAEELMFITKHLVAAESYLLERQDLHRIGVCKSSY